MNNKKVKIGFLLLGLPALTGFLVLYIYPFLRTIWYSVIDNTFNRNFVFFDNFKNILGNEYYRLALWNTFTFSLSGVALIISISLLLSFGLTYLSKQFSFIRNFFILPMLVPTASIIFIWQTIFQSSTYIQFTNSLSVSQDFFTVLPVFLLYIWKNTGINVIIITGAIMSIPAEIQEAAALDGAKKSHIYRSVILPLISPQLTFVTILSFVNSLKNFRESYLFYRTNYPPNVAYTMQYYINNQFLKLNYPNLVAGSLFFTFILIVILLLVYRKENKYNEQTY